MRLRAVLSLLITHGLALGFPSLALALSTDDLLRLHKAGVPENIILLMDENDYQDVDRVIKLKKAGFKDESILTIIKHDLKRRRVPQSMPPSSTPPSKEKTSQADEAVDIKTRAKIKIAWYMLYRGDTVLQNSEEIDKATISMIGGKTLKLEWSEKQGLGLLDVFFKKPFKSPFYWELNPDDTLMPAKDGYPYMLKSAVGHKGKPDTDESHYWILYLKPKDPRIIDYIAKAIKQQRVSHANHSMR